MNEEWLLAMAVVSMLAASASAFWAYRSHRLGQRGLRLALQQDQSRRAQLSVSISDSFNQDFDSRDVRLYAFSLLIMNQAEMANSVTRIELLIDYEIPGGQVITAVFPSRPLERGPTPLLKAPLSLGPRDSQAGWCFFDVDSSIRIDHRIRGYRLVVTDAQESQVEVRTILVRDVMIPDEGEV